MKKFLIELDEEQLNIFNAALDLYARIGIGQFYRIAEPFTLATEYCFKHHEEDYSARLDDARIHLQKAAHILMDCTENGYGSHGIYSDKINEKCRIAFDMWQVIKYKINEETKLTPTFSSIKCEPIKITTL